MAETYLQRYAAAGFYTMQGRLVAPQDGRFQSFPRGEWQQEIANAADAGLRGIEWIYDAYGEGANPLETADGRAQLLDCLAAYSISVVSICADYFMDRPLLRCSAEECAARVARMQWLIELCPDLAIGRIVLPFVDHSRITSIAERQQVVMLLKQVLPTARKYSVELHLETDLGPDDFRHLLASLEDPLIKVNYDSGNSASLGYRPEDEFAAYGPRIGSFHIKDRLRGAGTVPLGQGDADFASLRQQLIRYDYRGDFVLQVARSDAGQETKWLREVSDLAAGWLRGDRLV